MISLGPQKPGTLGKLALALLLLVALLSTRAHASEQLARNAALADGVSTAVGLAAGAAEMNPLGPVLALGLKTVVFRYAESLPDTERPFVYAAAASVWNGAAANNLCVTAAILTGGSFAPVCIVVGAAWALKTWNDSEPERQFWAGCAMLRQYANEPGLECNYMAPPQVLVTEVTNVLVTEVTDTLVTAQEDTTP